MRPAAGFVHGRSRNPEPGVPSCYNDAFRLTTEADVNPLLAIIITAVLAFGAHVLLTLALRSK